MSTARIYDINNTLRDIGVPVWRMYGEAFVKQTDDLPCVLIGEIPRDWTVQPREWIQLGPQGQYRSVTDLISHRPWIVDQCSLLINWVQPVDASVPSMGIPEDFLAISRLEPINVLYRGSKNYACPYVSYDGSDYLRKFIEDPDRFRYSTLARTVFNELSAKKVGGDVSFQLMKSFVHLTSQALFVTGHLPRCIYLDD